MNKFLDRVAFPFMMVAFFYLAYKLVAWLMIAYIDCIAYGFSKAFCWAVVF